jgi:hypothetical protein
LVHLNALLFLQSLFYSKYLIVWLKVEGLFAARQGLDKDLIIQMNNISNPGPFVETIARTRTRQNQLVRERSGQSSDADHTTDFQGCFSIHQHYQHAPELAGFGLLH